MGELWAQCYLLCQCLWRLWVMMLPLPLPCLLLLLLLLPRAWE